MSNYTAIKDPIIPKKHIEEIRPLLPQKYSPLQQNGDGLQSVYSAEISHEFADLLIDLLRRAHNEISFPRTIPIQEKATAARRVIEDRLESEVMKTDLVATEREQIIRSRRGQGRFRESVQVYEARCRVSGVTDPRFLIASHIKPWRHSTNAERLDGENGLLLAPNIDILFDRGFISFGDDGALLISPSVSSEALQLLGVPIGGMNVGMFTANQKQYLSHHRREVFLVASRVL